jgi:hypothetical protein
LGVRRGKEGEGGGGGRRRGRGGEGRAHKNKYNMSKEQETLQKIVGKKSNGEENLEQRTITPCTPFIRGRSSQG